MAQHTPAQLVAHATEALLQFAADSNFTGVTVTTEKDERPFGFATWSVKLEAIDGSIGKRFYCLVVDVERRSALATGFHSLDSFTWNGWNEGEVLFDETF